VIFIQYLKREKKVKKIETKQHQEDNKVRMQEELLRKSLQKVVSIQEAHEKARRIMESKSDIADGDEEKTKAIDMLIDVQKQLLDVFAISKVNVCFPKNRHAPFKRLPPTISNQHRRFTKLCNSTTAQSESKVIFVGLNTFFRHCQHAVFKQQTQ